MRAVVLVVCSDGEIHKWQLNNQGVRMERQEFVKPRGYDNPFVLQLNYDDMKSMREEIQNRYGCNVYGWVNVGRVAGNIHFAVRQEAMMAADEDITTIEALLAHHLQDGGSEVRIVSRMF